MSASIGLGIVFLYFLRVSVGVLTDDVLPDGTVVKKGDILVFFPWIMGRDKSLWGEDAEEFKPERFLDKPKPNPFIYTAFQAGPRTCLGQNFAILEMKCCIARLLVMFEFALEQDPKSVTYTNSLTLPIKGMSVLVFMNSCNCVCRWHASVR